MNFKKFLELSRIPARRAKSVSPPPASSTLDDRQRLELFLLLGTETGTYTASDFTTPLASAPHLLNSAKTNGKFVVSMVLSLSGQEKLPRPEPCLLALAAVCAFGDPEAKSQATDAIASVCRRDNILVFARMVDGLRGWGRGLRSGMSDWYNRQTPSDLAYTMLQTPQRNGWSHRDLIRLCHPVGKTDGHRELFRWVTQGTRPDSVPLVVASEEVRSLVSPSVEAGTALPDEVVARCAGIVRQAGLTREMLPPVLLQRKEIWAELLPSMGTGALLRNLGNLSRVGLVAAGSQTALQVADRIRNSHSRSVSLQDPFDLLTSLASYVKGSTSLGGVAWPIDPVLVESLEFALARSLELQAPLGKKLVVGLDVSGSMATGTVGNSVVTACEAATLMALGWVTTDRDTQVLAFGDHLTPLALRPSHSISEAVEMTKFQRMGEVNPAAPLTWALKHRVLADAFVVFTDKVVEGQAESAKEALETYRQRTGIAAKLAVVGLCSTGFRVADPDDPGMLDVVGFDGTVPYALNAFLTF